MIREISLIRVICVTVLLSAVLSGCGYSTKSLILNDIKTIHIKTFANKIDITAETTDKRRFVTYRPLLEVDLTRVAIDRFLFDGNLKIVSRENEADAVLYGELVDFRQDPLRYDSAGNVEEYRLNIVMNLRLMNQNKNELIWEEKNFTGDTAYFTSGSRAETEADALDRAITDLARRLVERTIEGW